ncbi:probable glucan endo-1,3-beta-glucosidase BG5 [Pyrus communis]|uniref:probable glucan endo-1,3-beta-glucosidase BG5 n=1 Tax=Pyrus communis TaxID=23211 RepID=UPI0035BEFA5F
MAVLQWIAFTLSFLATIYNHNIEIVEAKMTLDIGVNYGTLGDNLPSHEDVVQLFKDNHINKMRLFNPNPEVLKALMGQGISIVLGIPNEDLASLSESQEAVDQWFAVNVQPYIDDIEFNYIAVGNEVIPGELGSFVWQVMQYLQHTIDEYHYQSLRVTTVLPATALGVSYPPSAGQFSGEAAGIMASICPFLNYQGSPLMINVYPYFAYAAKASDIPLDYAQFTATKPGLQDGNLSYYNLFDATVDAFFSAIEKSGGPDVAVVVSESGWPSAGNGDFTDTELAGTYVRNFVRHITSNVGTPKRPGAYIEGFVFAMFNENQKPSEEEQNFGIFYPNKKPVYPVF